MSPKKPPGKRVIPVPVKFSQEEKAAFQEVGSRDNEDRPLGFVIRELAIRGLVEYRKDGKLRATEEEASAALSLSSVSEMKGGHSRKKTG